jgi:hypothetical protein
MFTSQDLPTKQTLRHPKPRQTESKCRI